MRVNWNGLFAIVALGTMWLSWAYASQFERDTAKYYLGAAVIYVVILVSARLSRKIARPPTKQPRWALLTARAALGSHIFAVLAIIAGTLIQQRREGVLYPSLLVAFLVGMVISFIVLNREEPLRTE